MSDSLRNAAKEKYGAVAESTLSSNDAGVKAIAEAFGYSTEELTSIPAAANMGLSCGNPTATANLQPGETVLDLGSGGGLDVFLASAKVGPQGRVIGVDMTPSMIERAETNARDGGYANVEFHLAPIDHLPLSVASVDCVLSNCVLNLAPDKPAVFREIFRVLKPGGRLAISDIALKAELPQAIASSLAAYIGCVAGAIHIEDYRTQLREAGFESVQIVDSGSDLNGYSKVENQSGCCSPAMTPAVATIDSRDDRDKANAIDKNLTSGSYACCGSEPTTLHEDLSTLLSSYYINQAAASVRVYALKPSPKSCCGPSCCS